MSKPRVSNIVATRRRAARCRLPCENRMHDQAPASPRENRHFREFEESPGIIEKTMP